MCERKSSVSSKNIPGEPTLAVAVVVINYNGVHYLPETIAAIRKYTFLEAEIILVDNASTDGSIEYVTHSDPSIRVVRLSDNRGPGVARNVGLSATQAEYVLFLDNDVIITESTIELLVAAVRSQTRSVISMPAIIYHNNQTLVQYAGADAHFLGTVKPLHARRNIESLPKKPFTCTSLISAAFMVRRSRLGSSYLFDENIFIYQDDHEAGLRQTICGKILIVQPEARCIHREGTIGLSVRATTEVNPIRTANTIANRWNILISLHPRRHFLFYWPALLTYELFTLLRVLIKRDITSWQWALKKTWRNLPELIEKRRTLKDLLAPKTDTLFVGGMFPFNEENELSNTDKVGQTVFQAIVIVNWHIIQTVRYVVSSCVK